MGRWSARLAPLFLDFCRVDGARRLLDVGCGTGVLSEAMVQRWPAVEIVGIDPAEDYIAYARRRLAGSRAKPQVGDALALPGPDAAFDGCLALLILQEFSEPECLVREMTRVTSAGSVVATCQWDFADGMPMLAHFWEAVSVAHPLGDAEREAKRRVPPGHTSEASLAKLWDVCGLSEIATASLEVPLSFAGFEDYWRPFLSGATPTSTYAAGLPPGVQDAIKAELRQRLLGDDADRPFTLTARALAVRGQVRRT